MSFVTESHENIVFTEGLGFREATTTLLEVSIAALTTEPELQNIGRSLISLARYHASKMASSP